MASFLLGAGGRLILANGKPLSFTPGQAPNTGITLVPFFLNTTQASDAFFVIQTTAASGDTTGNVPFPFAYTGGAPSSVQARIIDANGNPLSGFDWADISSSVTMDGAGNGLGYVNAVPAGVGYKRQVRVSTSTTLTSADTSPFNIGQMLLLWGQSNMVGTLTGGIGQGNAVPGTAYTELSYYDTSTAGAFFGEKGFVGSSNNNTIGSYSTNNGGGLSLLRLVGTQLQQKFGRKAGVAINPWAINGTSMSGFVNSANGSAELDGAGAAGTGTIGFSSYLAYKNVIANGDYRLVAWHQGETPDSDESPPQRVERFNKLVRFCQKHINQVANFGRTPDKLTFLFAIMGVGSPSHMEVLRGAVLDLVDYGKTQSPPWDIRVGWNCIDLAPPPASDGSPGLHFAGADQTRSVRRLTQACMHTIDPTNVPYGAAGPSIKGAKVVVENASPNGTNYISGNATRAGDVVTLTVTHEGGTALVAKTPGSPITGWYANMAPDFSGTDIALTNVTILPPNQIQVTATGAPATFYIKHCGGKLYTLQSYAPDVSNLIYDNFVYPTGANSGDQFTGLPLQPTPDAIKVG